MLLYFKITALLHTQQQTFFSSTLDAVSQLTKLITVKINNKVSNIKKYFSLLVITHQFRQQNC